VVMADEPGEQDELFTRAAAAIAEAERLMQANRERRKSLDARLRRMHYRATFFPKALKIHYLSDFPEPRRFYQPFPNQAEDDL
jgi:hypothetical protein